MNVSYPRAEGSVELWLRVVNAMVAPIAGAGGSMISYCAGDGPEKHLPIAQKTFVDSDPQRPMPDTYGECIRKDVLDSDVRLAYRAYDLAICSDGIEHLPRQKAIKLLERMQQVATKYIIVFTPLGDLDVKDFALEASDYDRRHNHHSGWNPEDVEFLGWDTFTFPRWHKDWAGAWFGWHGASDEDWERVTEALKDL